MVPNHLSFDQILKRNWKLFSLVAVLALGLIILLVVIGIGYLKSQTRSPISCVYYEKLRDATYNGTDLAESPKCELYHSRDYIAGGEPVKDSSRYPWMVSIIMSLPDRTYSQCGGSIIDDLHILTAAHCFANLTSSAGLLIDVSQNIFQIRLGSINLKWPRLKLKVKAAFINKGFSLKRRGHDIAVLRLAQSLKVHGYLWNNRIKPACLPAASENTPRRCEALGWGRTSHNGSGSNILLGLDLNVYNISECVPMVPEIYANEPDEEIDYFEICSDTGPQGGRDVCFGDSGGPVLCSTGLHFKQFGVISATSKIAPCGSAPGFLSFHTSVPFYRGWLEYVARTVLEDVQVAQIWLDCLIKQCHRLRKEGYKGIRISDSVINEVCELFAAYVFCMQNDPKHNRCAKTTLPFSPKLREALLIVFKAFRSRPE